MTTTGLAVDTDVFIQRMVGLIIKQGGSLETVNKMIEKCNENIKIEQGLRDAIIKTNERIERNNKILKKELTYK